MRFFRIGLSTIGLAAIATVACTITLPETEDAEVLAPVTAEVKGAFQSAISTVTAQVITAAMDAVTVATPAPSLIGHSLRKLAESATVNHARTTDDGGKITVSGTITSSGTEVSGSITLDLKAEWTNLSSSDGTATQKSSGSETISGTITWDYSNAQSPEMEVNTTLHGSFTLGSDSYTFDLTMTLDGENLVYTGKVNGETVSGSFSNTAGERTSGTSPAHGGCEMNGSSQVCSGGGGMDSCQTYNYTFCIEFTDQNWTDAGIASVCTGGGTRLAACPASGRIGRCTNTHQGNVYTYHSYSVEDTTEQDCLNEGGTWQAN